MVTRFSSGYVSLKGIHNLCREHGWLKPFQMNRTCSMSQASMQRDHHRVGTVSIGEKNAQYPRFHSPRKSFKNKTHDASERSWPPTPQHRCAIEALVSDTWQAMLPPVSMLFNNFNCPVRALGCGTVGVAAEHRKSVELISKDIAKYGDNGDGTLAMGVWGISQLRQAWSRAETVQVFGEGSTPTSISRAKKGRSSAIFTDSLMIGKKSDILRSHLGKGS